MVPITNLLLLFSLLSAIISAKSANQHAQNGQPTQTFHFAAKLDKRVELFNTSGRTLAASVLDLAYEYELPTGIEYIDHEAATKPINLELHNESVRGILLAIVQQLPEYRISFSGGLVNIYAPKARENPSNLFNKVIKSFAVTELDTHRADMELVCTLAREIAPPGPCGGSIAVGQWGSLKITLHLQNAKVYEILNAMVAQNGRAAWTVITQPSDPSKIPVGGLWHIYPLEPPFKDAVLVKLTSAVGDARQATKQ